MNQMAKVLKGGVRQLVELPEGFEIAADEVFVRREGDSVVLDGADEIDPDTGLPLATLRRLIQEGIDSGPGREWDAEELKRYIRSRHF